MMKQAQELQGRMAELQEQLAQLEIPGAPGAAHWRPLKNTIPKLCLSDA